MNKKHLLIALSLLSSVFTAQVHACNATPIVFVHGYLGATWNFNIMVDRFKNSGYPSCALYKFGYNSVTQSNKSSADQLRGYVDWVRSRHQWQKVNVVAHSNGGLVSRWFRVFKDGYARNDRLVTIGTPHKGTSWAYACFSPACYEMRPYSSFQQSLAGRGCDVSLWSSGDEIINPDSSAKCGYSQHVGFMEHNYMLASPSVYSKVRNHL